MNKLCNVASFWIYIGILLAHPILHISWIRVKLVWADELVTTPYLPKTFDSSLEIYRYSKYVGARKVT
jgi:hypothetical protein